MKYYLIGLLAVAGLVVVGIACAVPAHAQYISPLAVTGVSASFSPPSHVNVSWTAPASSTSVVGYYVYRNGGQIANTGSLSYLDTVTLQGSYFYTVAGYDVNGNAFPLSAASSPVSVTIDTTPPTTPTGVTTTVTTSSITINWTASTDNVGVVGYYIYRNGGRLPTASAITGQTYTDVGIPVGTTMTYSIIAYDAAGNLSPSSVPVRAMTFFDPYPPSTPGIVSAVATSSSEIDITWVPAIDNIGVVGYYLYRNGSQVANPGPTSTYFADTGLSAQTSYSYSLTAYDAAGNISQASPVMVGTTLELDTVPPSPPINPSAIDLTPTHVTLTWFRSLDNVGVVGYTVYRDSVQIGNVTSTSYVDTGLSPGTKYDYNFMAYDAAGNDSTLSGLLVTTPIVMPSSTAVSVPTSSVPVSPVASSSVATSTVTIVQAFNFTTTLYLGLRGNAVKALQNILVTQGDLGANYATGFYGALTQKAVQQFQCAQNVVCTGSPWTTGWGMVGGKTRKVLNGLGK